MSDFPAPTDNIPVDIDLIPIFDWLISSIDANNGFGSSAYYSRVWHSPLRLSRWSSPYPETSGYILETLIDYSEYFPRLQVDGYINSFR